MARVLAISSHVARGSVGLAATVPALQWLGHEVWALPTVLLANRPGLGPLAKHEIPARDLEAMLTALEADGCWEAVDAVLAGYFASRESVLVVARAVGRIKKARAQVHILIDPILGDAGRLYVSEDTANAIRDELVALATIATPNLFELQWLSGTTAVSRSEIEEAARSLGPPAVVVTSAIQTEEHVTTLLVGPQTTLEQRNRTYLGVPNGAGDLFAGLLLGHVLNALPLAPALDASLQELDRVLAASEGKAVLQLSTLMPRER
jgi:pyridoxine kinase